MMNKKIYSLALCTLLIGCMVGPDYHKPKTDAPESWRESKALDNKAVAEEEWWKHFNDPVLDDLVAKALAQNFDIRIAEARITQARAQLSSARADLLPQVNMTANATREANEIVFGNTTFPKPFNIFQTGFDASWELDIFGGKRRALEEVYALFGASKISRDDVRISVLAEIARNYINIRRYQAQLAIAEDTLKAEQEIFKIQQELYTAGSTPKTDLIRAQTAATSAQTQTLYYKNLLSTSEYVLDLLLGEKPGTAHQIVSRPGPVPVMDKELVLAAPAQVIFNRPDVRIAERELAASSADIGVAKAQMFPNITLGGFFGLLSPSTNTLLNAQSKAWNVNAGLLWPILNYQKLSANVKASQARNEEALLVYKKAITAALVDVESSLSAYSKQEESRGLLEKNVAENTNALSIAQSRYKTGVSDFTEVLNTEKVLYNSQSQLADVSALTSQSLVAVYKSLGGGWKKEEPKAAQQQVPTQAPQPQQPQQLQPLQMQPVVLLKVPEEPASAPVLHIPSAAISDNAPAAPPAPKQ